MFDKIIQDCMGEALYNGLVESFNGGTIVIQFVEGAAGSFGPISETNKSTGIKLGMQMESNQLLHEMFHAYQSYQTTTSDYNATGMNREIEAHYAQYLYVSRLPEYQSSDNKWKRRYSTDSRYAATKSLENYIDDKGNLLTNGAQDIVKTFIEYTICPIYREHKYDQENYPYIKKTNVLDNFKNIKKLTKDC